MGLDITHLFPAITQTNEFFTYFELKEFVLNPSYIDRHKNYIGTKNFDEFGKAEVIYFEQIGFQRSGMKNEFYSDFQNDKLYFDLQSVKKAYNYLRENHIMTLAELQKNFQENFINNFIEEQSIFHVSW